MCAAYLLGIDAGTTVIKSTLFDLDGRGIAGAAHDSSFLTPHPGWAESDMATVWQAVQITVRQTFARSLTRRESWIAVGVTGQGDGTWLVDRARLCARPSSGRTGARPIWSRNCGRLASVTNFPITGTALDACRPGIVALARRTSNRRPSPAPPPCWPKDWLFLCLTGAVSTDTTDASHTYFSVHTGAYDERVLALLGVEAWRPAIPPAPRPAELHAPLLEVVTRELGLRPGTPVVAGPFDVAASALGVGAAFPGDACSVLGTAGVHQVMVDAPVLMPADIGYNMHLTRRMACSCACCRR